MKKKENKQNRITNKLPKSPKHILIVDDEKLLLHSLEFLLTQAHFKVTLKDKAGDVLELFKEKKQLFDLLILDILIADFSGLELIDAMESLEIPIPTIVISGYADSEIEKKLNNNFVVGYLNKPFQYEELLRLVNQVFKREPHHPYNPA